MIAVTETPSSDSDRPEASLAERLQAKYGDLFAGELSRSLIEGGETPASASDLPAGTSAPLSPNELDRYTVGSEIARGGMGAILEVWDRDFARPLAMKVLLPDPTGGSSGTGAARPEAIQRFVREARITGQLDHPGIVPVHELGIDDDGQVFFTMRLVRGIDLAEVFAKAQAGIEGWNRTRVLEVIMKICDTVAYAHSRGVVHRDLKPSNVMVGDFGEVSVLDWGLAKLLDSADEEEASGELPDEGSDPWVTQVGTVLGTPSYMAPEQARGETDASGPALDVYSLGAMLYTLLAGRPPYIPESRPTSSREIVEAVRSGPPTPLATLGADLSEGLVKICDRAMRRAPADRYATAAEMTTALRDHLEAERVSAEESKRLRDQLDDARGVSKFLSGLFRTDAVADASQPVSVVELLDRGAATIEEELAGQPAMLASVHATLGDVFNSIGLYPKGIPHFEESVRLARKHAEQTNAQSILIHRLTGLAQVLYETGEYERAEEILRESIDLCRTHRQSGEPLARALSALCTICWNNGRIEEALPLAEESLALRREVGDLERLAISLNEVGVLVDSLGQFEEAEKYYREAMELRIRVLGPRHAMIGTILINLGALCCYRLDFEGAVEHYREALAIRREGLGDVHPKVALALVNLGYALGQCGELEEAETIHRECLAMRQELMDEQHPMIAHAMEKLALVLIERDALDEANELLEQASTIVDAKAGELSPFRSWIHSTRSRWHEKRGEIDKAVESLEASIKIDLADGEELNAHSVDHIFGLGQLLLRHGRAAEALPHLEQCLEVYERQFRPQAPIRIRCEKATAEARNGAKPTL